MPTLSLAMIVKNEIQHLGHCLASVHPLVDEMVVVDTGSTDGTPELARTLGAKVFHHPWQNDFSAARNESLRHCSGSWILVLDADEAVDALDHPIIRRAVAQGRHPAYNLTLRNYVEDGNAIFLGQTVTPNQTRYTEGRVHPYFGDSSGLRLCRNLPGLAYEGRIHELLTPFFHQRRLPIGELPAVIHHYGKTDASREAAKATYYLQLAEEEASQNPTRAQAQFNLMIQASIAERWPLALASAEACLRLQKRTPPAVRATLALACVQLGRPGEAEDHLRRLLQESPGHQLGLRLLTRLYSEKGDYSAARNLLSAALEQSPEEPTLHEQLIALGLRAGQEAQAAADAWKALQRIPGGGGGHWHALVAAFLLRGGQARQGRAVVELGLQHHPGHEGLRRLAETAP